MPGVWKRWDGTQWVPQVAIAGAIEGGVKGFAPPVVFERETAWEANQGSYSEYLLSGTFVAEEETARVEFDLTGFHQGIAHVNAVLGYKPGTEGPVRSAYFGDPLPVGAVHVPLVTTRTHGTAYTSTTLTDLVPGQEYFFEVFLPVVGYFHYTNIQAGANQTHSVVASPDGKYAYTYEWVMSGSSEGILKKWRMPTTVDEVQDEELGDNDELVGTLNVPAGIYAQIGQQAVTADSKTLYLPVGTSVVQIDLTTMTITATHANMAPAGQTAASAALSPDGTKLYLQSYGGTNTLRKFAVADLTTVVWSIDIGTNLLRGEIRVSPDGTKIACPGTSAGGNWFIVIQDNGATVNANQFGVNIGTPIHHARWMDNSTVWVGSGTNLRRIIVPANITPENAGGAIAETVALGGSITHMTTDPLRNSLFIGCSTGTYRFQCRYINSPEPSFIGKIWERATFTTLGSTYPIWFASNYKGDIIYIANNKNLYTFTGAQYKIEAQPDLFYGTKASLSIYTSLIGKDSGLPTEYTTTPVPQMKAIPWSLMGHSWTVDAGWHTTGIHWANLLAEIGKTGAVTRQGIGGTTMEYWAAVIDASPAGAYGAMDWGRPAAKSICIMMNVLNSASVVDNGIPFSIDSFRQATRTVVATVLSDRIGPTFGVNGLTHTGFATTNLNQAWSGTMAYTTANGGKVTWTVQATKPYAWLATLALDWSHPAYNLVDSVYRLQKNGVTVYEGGIFKSDLLLNSGADQFVKVAVPIGPVAAGDVVTWEKVSGTQNANNAMWFDGIMTLGTKHHMVLTKDPKDINSPIYAMFNTEQIALHNEVVDEIKSEFDDIAPDLVTVVDLEDIPSWQGQPMLWTGDTVHPNDRGMQWLAAQISRQLAEKLPWTTRLHIL